MTIKTCNTPREALDFAGKNGEYNHAFENSAKNLLTIVYMLSMTKPQVNQKR